MSDIFAVQSDVLPSPVQNENIDSVNCVFTRVTTCMTHHVIKPVQGLIVAGIVPIWDFHATGCEKVDLLIYRGGWFGILQFPAPRKK